VKNILIVILIILSVSCHSQTRVVSKDISPINIVNTCDSVSYYKHQNDSLKSALFLSQYKIAQVNFYVKLCEKKPSQKVFLLGWVKRAIK